MDSFDHKSYVKTRIFARTKPRSMPVSADVEPEIINGSLPFHVSLQLILVCGSQVAHRAYLLKVYRSDGFHTHIHLGSFLDLSANYGIIFVYLSGNWESQSAC